MGKLLLFSLTLALCLSACGDDDPVSSKAGEPTSEYASRLVASAVDQEWVLEAFVADEVETAAAAGTSVTLRFSEDGRVSGSAGCNSYAGAFAVVDSAKVSIGHLASTEMACLSGGVMDQESRYLRSLAAAIAIELGGEALYLYCGDGGDHLRFAAAPDGVDDDPQDGHAAPDSTVTDSTVTDSVRPAPEDLIQRLWQLRSFEYRNDTGSFADAVPVDVEITAVFSGAGQVKGRAGCNEYFGRYEVGAEDGLTIHDVGLTEMFCQTPDLMAWEERYRNLLDDIDGYHVEGERLALSYGGGSGILHFVGVTDPTVHPADPDPDIDPQPLPADVRLTEADAGDTIDLRRPGVTVEIALESNTSTGYAWLVADADSTTLLHVGDVFEGGTGNLLGAPGIQRLFFEAQAPGRTTLRLVYARIWESVAPADTFEVSFFVHGGIVPPPVDPAVDPLGIRLGSSFGECRGYCWQEMILDEEAMVLVSRGWDEATYPERVYKEEMDPVLWRRLQSVADFAVFDRLNEVYGCPDCADGGSEWVSVNLSGRMETVKLEYGAELEPIAALLGALRRLRAGLEERSGFQED